MTFAPNPKQALFLWKMINAETLDIREPTLTGASPKLGKDRKPLVDEGLIEVEKRGSATHLMLTDKAWAWANQCTDVALMQSNARDGAIALQGLLRRLVPFLQSRGIPLADLYPTDIVDLVTPNRPQVSRKQADPKKLPAKKGKLVKKSRTVKKDVPTQKTRTSKKGRASKKLPIAKKVRPGSGTQADQKMLSSKKRQFKRGGSDKPKVAQQKQGPTRKGEETRGASADVQLLSGRIRKLCLALSAGRPTQEIRLTALRSRLPKVSRISLDSELLRMQQAGQIALYRDDNSLEVTEEDERDALFVGDAPRHLLYLKG